MNLFINHQIQNNRSLLEILLGQKTGKKTKSIAVRRNTNCGKRDTVTISSAGQEMSVRKVSSGRAYNTKIDNSIDLQSYIDAARKSNEDAIANAGTEISTNIVCTSPTDALRAALTEKYKILVSEAKRHSDPEDYIYRKYFDESYAYYEKGLSDAERDIGYLNERTMYRDGHTFGLNFQDSLFRRIQISTDIEAADRIKFERQIINAQISNIMNQAGIDTEEIPETCKFTVDPYTYEISVDGVEHKLKHAMENALNVGNNGEQLFFHIKRCATQSGCNSTQPVSKESNMKYRAYQDVYDLTGLKLNELSEKSGTYYTQDGQDILNLVNAAIDKSDKIREEYKAYVKIMRQEMISAVSKMGWNNIPDMRLSILFGKNGLKDINQSIIYQYDKTKKGHDDKVWYHVI